jgi:hypothetical protein
MALGGEYRRSRFQRVGTYESYRIAVASCVYMARYHTRQRRGRCTTTADAETIGVAILHRFHRYAIRMSNVPFGLRILGLLQIGPPY